MTKTPTFSEVYDSLIRICDITHSAFYELGQIRGLNENGAEKQIQKEILRTSRRLLDVLPCLTLEDDRIEEADSKYGSILRKIEFGELPEVAPIDDVGGLLERLDDRERDDAVTQAALDFFNDCYPGLNGRYAISNYSLVRGDATEAEMMEDAPRFGINPAEYPDDWADMLLEQLDERFDEVLYDTLCAAVEKSENNR